MESSIGSALFPLHRCKTLHLLRHAQGTHNLAGEKDFKAYLSSYHFDAHLTPLGWQQVDNLRRHVRSSGLFKELDLVIVSPLMRTMQTAVGVFGGDGYTDGITALPLMVKNAGSSDHKAISCLNCPPFLAVEKCREHLQTSLVDEASDNVDCGALGIREDPYAITPCHYGINNNYNQGVYPCDKRRTISEYRQLFPAIDFSLIDNDDDILWKAEIRETNEELAARGVDFLNWLWSRKEKEIAIVTHGGFLRHTLKKVATDYHPLIEDEFSTQFANCELRSMTLVDRCAFGSDSSSTNYSGKIPK